MSHLFHKKYLSSAFFLCALLSSGQEPVALESLGYSAVLQLSGEGAVTVDQGIEAAVYELLDRSNSTTQKSIREALVITQEAKDARIGNIKPLMISDAWTILESFHYLCELLNLNLECIDGKIKIDRIQQKIDRVRYNHAVLINRDVHSLLTGSVKFDIKVFNDGGYFELYDEAFKGMNMLLKDIDVKKGMVFYEASWEAQRRFTMLLEQYINNKLESIKRR